MCRRSFFQVERLEFIFIKFRVYFTVQPTRALSPVALFTHPSRGQSKASRYLSSFSFAPAQTSLMMPHRPTKGPCGGGCSPSLQWFSIRLTGLCVPIQSSVSGTAAEATPRFAVRLSPADSGCLAAFFLPSHCSASLWPGQSHLLCGGPLSSHRRDST